MHLSNKGTKYYHILIDTVINDRVLVKFRGNYRNGERVAGIQHCAEVDLKCVVAGLPGAIAPALG